MRLPPGLEWVFGKTVWSRARRVPAAKPRPRPRGRTVLRSWASSFCRRMYDRVRLNFTLYPGAIRYKAADFLTLYYEEKRRSAGWMRRALDLIIYVGFQAWVPFRAKKVAQSWGKDRAWTRRTVAISRDRFVDPNDIALFRIERGGELDHYMRRFEHIGVGRAIAAPDTDHGPLLTDKRRFYDYCESRGMAHPPMLATLEDGRERIRSLPPDGCRLFIKPARGSGGKGAQVCVFRSNGEGSADAFRRFLLDRPESRGGHWIVQERLETHPEMRDISARALPTVRITTLLNERNEPEIVTTVLRLAATMDEIVDNIGIGGLSAPVDLATGLLGPACGGMRPGEFDRHPVTGGRIEGRAVSQWSTMKQLALDAHALNFRDHVMIGWDVAVAHPQPCLLEANPRPSIIMAQRACRVPVGKTRMGELIAYHLDQRLNEGMGRPRFLSR